MNVLLYILGACLCDAGGIELLWLFWYRFSSAALFCDFGQWLIVMNCIFSYKNRPMKLKLSHTIGNSIGQPRMCLYLTVQMCSSQERGSPWWASFGRKNGWKRSFRRPSEGLPTRAKLAKIGGNRKCPENFHLRWEQAIQLPIKGSKTPKFVACTRKIRQNIPAQSKCLL
jgi:hypothetical protein